MAKGTTDGSGRKQGDDVERTREKTGQKYILFTRDICFFSPTSVSLHH